MECNRCHWPPYLMNWACLKSYMYHWLTVGPARTRVHFSLVNTSKMAVDDANCNPSIHVMAKDLIYKMYWIYVDTFQGVWFRNCSVPINDLMFPILNISEAGNEYWCDWAPFGKLSFFISYSSIIHQGLFSNSLRSLEGITCTCLVVV